MRRGVAHALWERVQRELNARGMTQSQLVERTGVAETTINRLRTGAKPPLARTVKAICATLGIDEQEGMVLAGRDQTTDDSIDLRRAIELAPDLTDSGRHAMLSMYDALQLASRKAG